jgi:outer membrane receptor protein involved in Fe transport
MMNRLIIRSLASALMVCFSLAAFAQTTIKGKVKDSNSNEALIGANVTIKGTTTGTVTDYDGSFSIKTSQSLPLTLSISYLGYIAKDVEITTLDKSIVIELAEDAVNIGGDDLVITGQRISEKQKAAPLTVESMDLLAIKSTPSDNFYDGLGSLKGVDLTAASLGFKVINTRGFNSTSPVRSLQTIDGVDNQAPGLNFSLGNFLGSSELDVLKVDLVVGASSAFYGPNAFNGVISMETKSPFYHKGFSASIKGGERNMADAAMRWADVIKNKAGDEVFGYKLNFSYLRANDWEADNYDPISGGRTGFDNPGGWDGINNYGDEYRSNMDLTTAAPWDYVGLGVFHRTGYNEIDLVDYGTKNIKANGTFHFRTNPSAKDESPEIIFASNFGNGTTVYQGDNRFSLKDILFFQNRLEFRKKDKFFIRAYVTQSDAGNSYDPYFTALKLQEAARKDSDWGLDYANWWKSNIDPMAKAMGYPDLDIIFNPDGSVTTSFDSIAANQWLAENNDSLLSWHAQAAAIANQGNGQLNAADFYEPGTDRFNEKFEDITTRLGNEEEGGTRFYDRSALYHVHGEYKFEPKWAEYVKVGANSRLYTPSSKGTVFYDTADIKIQNFEIGMYAGLEKKFLEDKLTLSATVRADKNQNFKWLISPAASLVWKPSAGNYFRFSFSSAIRNPTLTDQYLNLNVGRAILSGNLSGVDSLITIGSFLDYTNVLNVNELEYFSIDAVRPERVRTFEVGYRTTLFEKVYMDANYYFNFYNDFLGYNVGIDAQFDAFGFPSQLQVFRYAANSNNQVTTQGFAIGLNYYFKDYFMVAGNYSWNRLNKEFDDDPIIPAFNTPEHKFNLSFSGRDIVFNIGDRKIENLGFSINYKWIQGFVFEGSPQFTGDIPSYDLLDAQVNYQFKKINTTLKIGATNILNNKQFQTYGGPRIGRLAYISAVYEFKNK